MEKNKIIAKCIDCNDTSHMWECSKFERPGLCPVCHNVVEQIPNLEYKVRKNKRRDLMITYDGFHIASQKFKNFCDENGYENLIFIQFPKSPQYYFFIPQVTFKLDPERGKFQFGNYRECCGCYDDVTLTYRYKCKDEKIDSNDFIRRSNYLFAGGLNAFPLIIIGTKTFEKIIEYGLSGFSCSNVYE